MSKCIEEGCFYEAKWGEHCAEHRPDNYGLLKARTRIVADEVAFFSKHGRYPSDTQDKDND